MDKFNLQRFIEAQEDMYPVAQRELQEGWKRSHWIWFIFPQMKHLGHSEKSRYYGISGEDEARAYLENPILGQRLRELCDVLLNLPNNDAQEIFGGRDILKLRSSMTLFDFVSPNDVFERVLDKYYRGVRDDMTLRPLYLRRR